MSGAGQVVKGGGQAGAQVAAAAARNAHVPPANGGAAGCLQVKPKCSTAIPMLRLALTKLVRANYDPDVFAGKHPPWKEVETLGLKDLEAVSTFLGEKKFLGVGDEPSQEDCTLFGLSCMILFNAPKNNAYREALKETCSNIFDHFRLRTDYSSKEFLLNFDFCFRRMQVRYWPEWKDD